MIPKLEIKPQAESVFPTQMTLQQFKAKDAAIAYLVVDPYCFNLPFQYKKATYNGIQCMFAKVPSSGIVFGVFYRVENDVLVIELIHFR